jgi:hypothetical protein
MATKALTDYHDALRILLGDEGDSIAGYDIQSERLDAALRAVVTMGYVPCLSLDPDNTPATHLAEAPIHIDTGAYLVAKAAHLMTAGDHAEMIRTRAFSVSSQPTAVRDRLHVIEYILEEIESRGNVCSTTATSNENPGLFAGSTDLITELKFCLSEHNLCCE